MKLFGITYRQPHNKDKDVEEISADAFEIKDYYGEVVAYFYNIREVTETETVPRLFRSPVTKETTREEATLIAEVHDVRAVWEKQTPHTKAVENMAAVLSSVKGSLEVAQHDLKQAGYDGSAMVAGVRAQQVQDVLNEFEDLL